MARPNIHTKLKRVNISLDGILHRVAQKYANNNDMDFSEMVARLLVGEMRSRKGIARRFPRKLKQEAAT